VRLTEIGARGKPSQRGELSYAKVRALTRVATPETEERLLAVGRSGTADHVERIVRSWRRVDRKAEAQETARRHSCRGLHVYQDEDGMVVIRGRLAPEVGAVLVQVLAAARETVYPKNVFAETPTLPQQQADALALVPLGLSAVADVRPPRAPEASRSPDRIGPVGRRHASRARG
jgi:hypothetical protein